LDHHHQSSVSNTNLYYTYTLNALADRILLEVSSRKIRHEGTGELQWINLNYAYRFLHRFFYFNYRRTQKEFLPFQIRKSDINKQLRERLENLEFEELNKIMLEVVRRLLEAVDCYYFHTSGIHGKIRWSFVDYICLI
jgi:hypothetical protein